MKQPTPAQCEHVAKILKMLAHPQRLMMLCYMAEGPKNVSELEELTGATQSGVSQFLSRMKLEGLIDSEREAQSVFYEIHDPKVKKLLQAMHKIFC